MKQFNLIVGLISLYGLPSFAQSSLQKTTEFSFSKFQLPATSVSYPFKPNIKWYKQNTLYSMDGNSGYTSIVIYDKYITKGPHYNSYYEIAPSCARAFSNPIPAYNAGDIGGALIYGLLSDVLDVSTHFKIGNTKISIY